MTLLALFASFALAQASGAADTTSTTPYATLYEVLSPVSKINAYDHLIAIERIESKSPGVRPEDIRVVIHAKQGTINVPVGPGGEVKFPVTDALREENPPVETNQPKGSLALIVNVALRVGDGLRVPWSDIEAGLTQVKAFYADSRAASAPAISGVEVHFSRGSAAMLTIEGKNERLLMADQAGHIIVTRDVALENTAPVLAFSRAPDFVLPYTDEKK
ncbi:MAG TPA: hypothetical protein VGO25_12160 [Rhodanobacteraceae bacterium]|jgi:hypothetical protein|nr:hypothetical protein [Rhodanobacteraceae bacterium]